MFLPKLSNEEIGCYHSKPSLSQIEQKIGPGEVQNGFDAILDQINQLEAIQTEFGSICGQIKESIRTMSTSN
jgi:hypothetical protein